MLAYHNDPALKTATLDELYAHQEADRIVQGVYWDGKERRGCAVGCLTHDPDGGHDLYPERWGIPTPLAYLEDEIFEALPAGEAKGWPLRFMSAIPVGADLSGVWPRFAIWLLTDPEWGVEQTTDAEDVKWVCRLVADGYRKILAGGISEAEAARITRAARDARAARASRSAYVAASADKLIELLEQTA